MRERPILFRGLMVRALLEGRKTQTRRIVKPQPVGGDRIHESEDGWVVGRMRDSENAWGELHCPYGVPGDRLWVRERWRIGAWDENEGRIAIDYADGPDKRWRSDQTDDDGEKFNRLWQGSCDELHRKRILADSNGQYHWKPGESPLRWRSGRFMPRWASRITLEVTDVRVHRLQEISDEDAIAEGLIEHGSGFLGFHGGPWQRHPEDAYSNLWDSINGPGSWASNPWVWAITFRRIEGGAK